MCGRFAITLPDEAMASIFDATIANNLPSVPNFNVCPTTQIHVVTGGDARHVLPMRWGFLPSWYKEQNGGPLLINARSETIAEKPAFKKAVRETRCLIPCSGFYEWTRLKDGTKLPWYIFRRDKEPMVFAGVGGNGTMVAIQYGLARWPQPAPRGPWRKFITAYRLFLNQRIGRCGWAKRDTVLRR